MRKHTAMIKVIAGIWLCVLASCRATSRDDPQMQSGPGGAKSSSSVTRSTQPSTHPSTARATRPATRPGPATTAQAATEKVTIAGEPFTLEIAADPSSREEGLMGRDHIDRQGGMLFVFPAAQVQDFWMKNCPI